MSSRKDPVVIILIAVAVVFCGMMFWAGAKITEKNDRCQQLGGILVKTSVDGYVCIDRSVLKNERTN